MDSIKRREWDVALVESNFSDNSLHKFIARLNKIPVSYPPLLSYQGLIFGTKQKADLLVEIHWKTSPKKTALPTTTTILKKWTELSGDFFTTSLRPRHLSLLSASSIIKKLDCKKAPGLDQIKNIALRSLPINAITHLTKIINKCLLFNHFPKPWKHAVITMIPKSNKDLKYPINFRSISLISPIAKIYEKILLARIKYTFDNRIIPDFQHGFRKETSTFHQLLRVANKIIYGFNHSKTTGGLFLVVEKAFDRLWHNRPIFKMIQINHPTYLIHTLADYLDGRTFQVRFDATISRTGQIQAGYPQGSNLSPILYSIYTHDFPTSPRVEVYLFADDAAILNQANTPHEV
ncbi:probable RNA-directed DNA polymerase from transposon X-element [Trichonephila clavipes]|nr:probable RNA-directed DNA polymerase from transposon X-element [Trichonephila clavipes]